MDYREILNIMSSAELFIILYCLILTIMQRNIFALYILVCLILKRYYSRILKKYMSKVLPENIILRPKGALNCNSFNCGGKPYRNGFPSGHMISMGLFFVVCWDIIQESSKAKINFSILILGIALGRILSKCHTPIQVLAGFLFGILYGIVILTIWKELEKMSAIMKEHRKNFSDNIRNLFG